MMRISTAAAGWIEPMGFFRDLLHVARMIREERQDGARLFGSAERLGKQLKI